MAKPLVSTRLEEPTFQALQEIARQQERKPAFLVRKVVERFVEVKKKGGKSPQAAA